MIEILLATTNRGKVRELTDVLSSVPGIRVVSPESWGGAPFPNVVEDEGTYFGNATKKAVAYAEHASMAVLADDSGLEVDALYGKPGVHSARYGGEHASFEEKIALLLREMKESGAVTRAARFRAVLVLHDPFARWIERTHVEEGVCEGRIGTEMKGAHGFGYDPIFIPQGRDHTMAELKLEEKQQLSHRGKAAQRMRSWLAERIGEIHS